MFIVSLISDQICHRFIIRCSVIHGLHTTCWLLLFSHSMFVNSKKLYVCIVFVLRSLFCLVFFFLHFACWCVCVCNLKRGQSIIPANGFMFSRRHWVCGVFTVHVHVLDITAPWSFRIYNIYMYIHCISTTKTLCSPFPMFQLVWIVSMRWKPIKDIFSKWNSIMAKSIKSLDKCWWLEIFQWSITNKLSEI